MLTATALGLGTNPEVQARGAAIVVRNPHGDPIALVVMNSPVTQKLYSVDKPEEFRKALQTYGVELQADVSPLKL